MKKIQKEIRRISSLGLILVVKNPPLILLMIPIESQIKLILLEKSLLLDLVHPIQRGHVCLTHSLYPTPPLVLSPPMMLIGRRWERKLLGNALIDGGMM
jgi:hypothetical protein